MLVEQVTAATLSFEEEAKRLAAAVSRFKIAGGAQAIAAPARPAPKAAQVLREHGKVMRFAEERRQVRCQCIDEVLPLGMVLSPQQRKIAAEVDEAKRAKPARQAAVDHLVLAVVESDAGMGVDQLAHLVKVSAGITELAVTLKRGGQ